MARPAPVVHEPDAPPAPDDTACAIRFLRPDEAGALTDAIERSYGETYDCRWVYDPAEIRRRLADGTLRSVVGESQGRIVGHLGLTRRDPDAPVGEAGQAVVDPAFRGHHIFETLKRALAEDARALGMLGMYSEATAAHPYSQRANLSLGASEAGFLLGYIPASVEYTGIQTAATARRQSAALFYLATNDDPATEIFPPSWHRGIVGRIAEHLGLARIVSGSPPPAAKGETELVVDVHDDHAEAFVAVSRLGADLVDAVAALTGELSERCDCVYLDLRLGDPATAMLPPAVHDDLGYFFGGVIPHLADGDVLRLQCLHRVEADPSDVVVASEFGAELLDYVFRRKSGVA